MVLKNFTHAHTILCQRDNKERSIHCATQPTDTAMLYCIFFEKHTFYCYLLI